MNDGLYPDGDWLFINRLPDKMSHGKSWYRAQLRLRLDKRDAMELAESLIRFARDREAETHDFVFPGTIERLKEE